MTKSATSAQSSADPTTDAPPRVSRTAERRSRLARLAREWTAERGLAGFTVEELCDEIGISRRTFFNYFASKEHAIVGSPDEGLDDAKKEEFVSRRDGAPLIEALVDLGLVHFDAVGLTPEFVAQFAVIVEREPKLVTTLFATGTERDRLLAELCARREGLPADDPRIRLAIQLTGPILRGAVMAHLAAGKAVPSDDAGAPASVAPASVTPSPSRSLAELAHEQLALARGLLAP